MTLTFQQNTVDTVNRTTYTFAAQPIGAASATRRVIVVLSTASARAVSSATIGGVAATVDATAAKTGTARLAIISAVVPTGTTADVVVTLNGGAAYMGIAVWTLSTGSPTGQTATSQGVTPLVMPLTTTAGAACVSVQHTTGTAVATWSYNASTERWNADIEGTTETYSGADAIASGTSTDMGSTPSSTNSVGLAAAYA